MVNPGDSPVRRNWFIEQYTELLAATRFLSTLPLPGSDQLFRTDEQAPRLFIGGGYFPIVGLLIALPLWGGMWLASLIFPPLLIAAPLVVGLILLTGGLHLDGLMDSCDGLFSVRSRKRMLEIMRDSRVGGFGVLGGISVLLIKFALFASLPISCLPQALVISLPASRWAMVLALRMFPGARPEGLGISFRKAVSQTHLIMAALASIVISWFSGHILGLLCWGGVTLVSLAMGVWVTRRLGGLTGDIYGAIAEISEVGSLLLFTALFKFFL